MAHVTGPAARVPIIRPSEVQNRFTLSIHHVAPEMIIPNGDRYVVEMIEIDDQVEFGAIVVIMQQPSADPRTPGQPQGMEARGVLPAVVVTRGNGHLLGLPDPRLAVSTARYEDKIVRESADVPMFFEPGDVVFVDHNARGRALRIVGREVRIVNQIDVLAKIEGVCLKRESDKYVAYNFDAVANDWVKAE